MPHNAFYYLRRMPHEGSTQDLIAACTALGFQSQSDIDRTFIKWHHTNIAEVVGDKFSLKLSEINSLESTMPLVTAEQGAAFNCVLSRLEVDKNAVHESGHAIAAYNHGFGICHVRLGARSEVQLCEAHDTDHLDYRDVLSVEKMQEFLAAGAAAEQVLFGEYRQHGSSHDQIWVNNLEILKVQAQTGQPPRGIDVFDNYVARAKLALSEIQIRALSAALKKAAFLGREEINAVLQVRS